MAYRVKELFYSLQGEGAQAGRPAIFCRFTGCNLWTGREQDRASAICRFCDTDFRGMDGTGGGRYDAHQLAWTIGGLWPGRAARQRRYVILTGGEPLLQVDELLLDELHDHGFTVAVETNGTQVVPSGVDWVCVSPKAGAAMLQRDGQELKVIYPQPGLPPAGLADLAFDHFFLQPMDGPDVVANTEAAVAYCLAHPQWRLSLQTHKVVGIR